jgi:hypothetical protein
MNVAIIFHSALFFPCYSWWWAHHDDERDQEAVEGYDGVLCAVCGSAGADPSDPIVFCDRCDLMVHASCSRRRLVLLALLCQEESRRRPPSCCLGPARGGAMKRTTEGQCGAHLLRAPRFGGVLPGPRQL